MNPETQAKIRVGFWPLRAERSLWIFSTPSGECFTFREGQPLPEESFTLIFQSFRNGACSSCHCFKDRLMHAQTIYFHNDLFSRDVELMSSPAHLKQIQIKTLFAWHMFFIHTALVKTTVKLKCTAIIITYLTLDLYSSFSLYILWWNG